MKGTRALHDLGQSIWLDNITRDLLDSGTLARYIAEFSVTGLTSNPTIFDHAIKNSAAYDAPIRKKLRKGTSGEGLFFKLALKIFNRAAYDAPIRKKLRKGTSGEGLFFELALEDLTRAADMFSPTYVRTNGMDG